MVAEHLAGDPPVAQGVVCEVEQVVGCCFRVEFYGWKVAAAVVEVRDQVLVSVVFDVRLPEAVGVGSLEAGVGSLSSRRVRAHRQVVLFEDRVDGAVADLDAASFQVCFDGFAAPAVCSSDL